MSQSVPVRLLHVALNVFFDRLEVVGDERIPSTGPAILTSNHPSSLMDAFVILATIRRRIHFLAAAMLFKNPLTSWLFRLGGALPVYREADDRSKLRRNVATFDQCRRLLDAGEVIAIFPEGITHGDPQVRAIKRGVARIALTAESRRNFEMGLRIFPVGLNYSELGKFRSRCLVIVGESIDLSSYKDRYRANRRNVEKELTEEIKRNLEQHTLHLKKLRLAELVREVESIYRNELMDRLPPRIAAFSEPERSLELSKAIIRAVEHFDGRQPKRVERIWESLRRYKRLLRWVGLSDQAFGRDPRKGRREGVGLKNMAGFVLGVPVAVYGLVNNILPYLIPSYFSSYARKNPSQKASLKFFSGCLSFPMFYVLQGTVCGLLFAPWVALIYICTLPPTGFFAIGYFRRLRRVWAHLRLASALLQSRRVVFKLAQFRARLIDDLDAAKQDYMKFLAESGEVDR
jgi:glycerol-3-phosphate O-acyltransferase/dihydroxyacetone phosphate acyltransferase